MRLGFGCPLITTGTASTTSPGVALAGEDAAKGEEWKAAIDAYGMTLKAAHAEQRRIDI
ncbi:MAG: hypothetical protein ACR2IV_01295 [Bryobacteraceae bacterium]